MFTKQHKDLKKEQHRKRATQKIAYILICFPVLTETFILQELQELERQGVQLHLFSLTKPPVNEGAEVVWNGQASVTYISQYSKLFLLMNAVRYFLKAPLRFAYICIIAITRHYRLRTLIGCLLCAAFLAAQVEHEDILHLHAHFAAESTTVAQFTHLLTGVSYSFTAHAYDIYLSSKKAIACKIQMARFVIAVTAYNQKYLAKLADQSVNDRIHCIYNGLNLQGFPAHPSDISLSQISPLILTVSRLVEKKGLFYLLHACRMLVDQGYEFTCFIVGDGPLRLALEQKIEELALSQRVILQGAQKYEQVLGLYQKATIMALPCIIGQNGDRDGLPTVLIEALYMGIPVVSTSVSGIPELITSEVNGLLVPPNDSAALARALMRLLDDSSLRCRLAVASRKIVLERFDIARNVKSLIRLFSI